MLPLLLWGEADHLRLPDFDPRTLPYFFAFLAAVVIGFLFLHWRARRKAEKEALSNRFMQIVLHHNLSKKQYQAVLQFFRQLKEAQQNEILLSQKAFAQHLHDYLEKQPELSAADRVEIFDKLFPQSSGKIEIRSVADLRSGEFCALDWENRSCLATVLKVKGENQVLLSTHDPISLPVGDARLYAYRPELGGFLLSGRILRTGRGSAIFEHSGAIEFRGDQHLMATVTLPVVLEKWPKMPMEKANEPAAEDAVPTVYYGETERISDRALTLRLKQAPTTRELNQQDFWELTLSLPEKALV
ncbi:MAG: hypothetical protein N2Z22_05525, partial [Turneriella sp.]|nr:hypothetical protein [Turneriella sp.]